MGMHFCQYGSKEELAKHDFRHLEDCWASSGDVTLNFANGHSWQLPDMAPLYIEMGWLPDAEFVSDVISGEFVGGDRLQTRGGIQSELVSIGYLNPTDNPLPMTQHQSLPADFSDQLKALMNKAAGVGHRAQSKGLNNFR